MSKINVQTGKTILSTGLLQLSGGAAMSTTLTAVTDQNNNASQLKLASNLTQVAGTLQIALDGGTYIDAQDTSGIDRFNVNRAGGSQQVNVDFASNPTLATTAIGAFRTYADGTNLSEAVTLLRNGNVGVGATPQDKLDVNGSLRIRANTSNFTSVQDTAVLDYVPSTVFTTETALRIVSLGSPTVGGGIRFLTRNLTTDPIERVRITPIGKVGIGETAPTAQLQVKGSGSTSATTSLLVQNSAGTELFKLRDDGYVNVAATNGMNIGGLTLSGLSYNGIINFGNNDLSIGCDVANRRVNLYSGNTNVLTVYKSATNYGVGISDSGSSYPVPSAVLQTDSTTRGFLPPRMTDAQVRAIATPAVGLMAYNTDLDCPVFYSAAGWRKISHSAM